MEKKINKELKKLNMCEPCEKGNDFNYNTCKDPENCECGCAIYDDIKDFEDEYSEECINLDCEYCKYDEDECACDCHIDIGEEDDCDCDVYCDEGAHDE